MTAWLVYGFALAIVVTIAATARSFNGGVPESLVALAVVSTALASLHGARAIIVPVAAAALVAFVVLAVRRRDVFRRMRPRRETAQLGAVLAFVVLAIAWLAGPMWTEGSTGLAILALAGSVAGSFANARRSRSRAAAPYRGAALEVESVGPRGLAPAAAAALVLVTPAVIALARYEVTVLR
ncbi:MAG TPA: hypothetical protein VGH28_31285 [Polyangiaceae bacterium]|jgi:hypothetical protein